jgi:hypothetical protein
VTCSEIDEGSLGLASVSAVIHLRSATFTKVVTRNFTKQQTHSAVLVYGRMSSLVNKTSLAGKALVLN